MSRIATYTRNNPIVIVLITLALCAATMTILAVAYKHQQHVNDRRFCRVISVFIMPRQEPSTPRSAEINRAMQDLAHHLGCSNG